MLEEAGWSLCLPCPYGSSWNSVSYPEASQGVSRGISHLLTGTRPRLLCGLTGARRSTARAAGLRLRPASPHSRPEN
jgi:hypothetical protein